MPAPMSDITGAKRYRRSLFGKLILQVEVRCGAWDGQDAVVPSSKWRDATPFDLYALGWMERKQVEREQVRRERDPRLPEDWSVHP